LTEKVIVGIAEFKVIKHPCVMETASLGSCVGIVLYDRIRKIAGFAHIMLPDSFPARSRDMNINIGKYADTAISSMINDMCKLGAIKSSIIAKIAGGACMFETSEVDPTLNIGTKNIDAVKEILNRENIAVIAEDVGSNYGRTVSFDTVTGHMVVSSAKYGKKTI
jgi:chemotaxis protein CheD